MIRTPEIVLSAFDNEVLGVSVVGMPFLGLGLTMGEGAMYNIITQ